MHFDIIQTFPSGLRYTSAVQGFLGGVLFLGLLKLREEMLFLPEGYPGMGFLEGVVDALTLSLFKEHLDDVLNNML